MMDFYQFINSQDIREHLQTIGYKFSAAEAAWLVYKNRSTTLKEKHMAWQTIIDTMPDSEISEQEPARNHKSLHTFLSRFMDLENSKIEKFRKNDGSRYVYAYLAPGMEQYDNNYFEVFSNYEECIEAIQAERSGRFQKGTKYEICKLGTADCRHPMYLRFTAEMEEKLFFEVFGYNKTEDEFELARRVFQHMRPCFPVPFAKGDIICDPAHLFPFNNPFVLLSPTENNCREHPDDYGCDSWGMNVQGYFQDSDSGQIYINSMCNSVIHDCMDCEYYRGNLDGKRRALTVLSDFVKGKIDVSQLDRTYRQILLEEAVKDVLQLNITEEVLGLAGLKEGKK